MALEALITDFENGNAAEKYEAACSIARKLGYGERTVYCGRAMNRHDWLTYALAYAPNVEAIKNVSNMIAG